ncbi:MAG: UDP-N-acetylmuramate--L-alanine ligase [Candidatus Chisholmbacteria bacterium RIFCSPLOWO2_01_FULL_49_14]|uniref:UDP-N-acetylmuramate--L-alanine ligase n=1 Tax=Candidatus Chisholmbacteria bacterium RIFCSPLOWO2_01_FULL_49_14 TaxID=1797593 RepID=A0A1G1W2Y0_9BACT|nr:MAG: UDP-N-acetylmuramate--L-alanine ligase [Candidatus Chisholmbacteria bacterium RIFCSPLOWO2_01_FULL_49_14]
MILNHLKHLHFSGIKGVGMTALALYAQDRGCLVTGSDVPEAFVSQEILVKRKIPLSLGFDASQVAEKTQALIYSGAFPENPQIDKARSLNIPALSYGQALGDLTQDKRVVATSGVGGKSTTAAMIAAILEEAKLHPSFVVGVGNIPDLGVPGKYSAQGKIAVVEADEYAADPQHDATAKFLYLNPELIVITNIEYDHPDVYANLDETLIAYEKFVQKLTDNGILLVNLDNPNIQTLLTRVSQSLRDRVVSYGFSPQAQWQIGQFRQLQGKTQFEISIKGVRLGMELSLPGRFNALNATASIAAATHLGVSQSRSIDALKKFSGTQRRFQRLGSVNGVEVWDDYAHHPSQILSTLTAAKSWFGNKRFIAVFQPHTYSRTKALFSDFAKALSLAEQTVITDIYASAREKRDDSISGELLARETKQYNRNTAFVTRRALLSYLKDSTKPGDVVMSLGAGDIYQAMNDFVSQK